MTKPLLVRVTLPSQEMGRRIADAAIEQRLAACANLEGPMQSAYIWKGVVEHAFEYVLWLKTTEPCWPGLEALVNELHSYDVPAIVAMPLTHAHGPYADWLDKNTKAPAE